MSSDFENDSNSFLNSTDTNTNNNFENNKTWERAIEKFKFTNGQAVFNSWIKPLEFDKIDGGILYIKAPTRFIKDWVSTNYFASLLNIVREDNAKVITIDIVVDANLLNKKAAITDEVVAGAINNNVVRISTPQTQNQTIGNQLLNGGATSDFESVLDSRYTFENFVVGTSNKFALSAAKSVVVSEEVLIENNPLYIHGSVGLGKTHLLQAIAWQFKSAKPTKKVAYLSAEKFMFQFIKSMRENNIVSFKEFFRKVDVLLIDDIQFICGKNTTQEEFIHTFNALIESGKQVVLAGDKHPNDLIGLDERMKSRLNWGLVTDVQNSTVELRVGILKAKAARIGVELPQNIAEFMAEKITSNIRELEGALNKIISKARLEQKDLTMDFVIDTLKDVLRHVSREVTIDEIKQKVAEHCHVRMTDLVSTKRNREIARPRQIAMYLAKKYTSKSLPEIGRNFGGKDHTTVLHAIRKIEELKSSDNFVKENLGELSKIIEK